MSKRNSKQRAKKASNAKTLARSLAKLVIDKNGEAVVIFDLHDLSPITDYFVIANGLSEIHLRSIAEHLTECERPHHIEGLEGASWVLLDFIDVIVHLFLKETREFYGLERLWGDAPILKIKDD